MAANPPSTARNAAAAGAELRTASQQAPGAPETPGPSIGPNDIYEVATECQRLFEAYLRSTRLYEKEVAELWRRFLTWTSFLGVLAPVSVCLDTRLAGTPEMKELVISMLAVLKKSLERGIRVHHSVKQKDSGAQASAETDAVMLGMTGSMDRLMRLAYVIRASSKPDEIEKVLASARKRGPDGFDEVIFALVKHRFPSTAMTESLQIQLASSIIYRRNRLVYIFKHETKLGAGRNDETDSETAPTEPAQLQHHPTEASATQRPAAFGLHQQDLIHSFTEDPRHGETKSNASSSNSSNPFIAAEYPKAPTVPLGHDSARCTICHRPQPRDILVDEKKWRRHVSDDLRPYVCVSEQCSNLPPAFSTRNDWQNHMQDRHRANWVQYIHRPHRWQCVLEHGTLSPRFDSEQLLLEHMRGEHSRVLSERQLVLIASTSRAPEPLEPGVCPFCGEVVTEAAGSGIAHREPMTGASDARPVAFSAMWKHIADHLESLALWSLRWWDDDSGTPAEGENHPNSQCPEQAASSRKHSLAGEGLGVVPFGRNADFVGRESILVKLLEIIPPRANNENCQWTAFQGESGVGKTEIALEAAYRVRALHPDCSIFWVPGRNAISFENAFREIGRQLKVDGVDEEGANVKLFVKVALSQRSAGYWLLVVDDVDDFELWFGSTAFARYLPFSRKGSILFTTTSDGLAIIQRPDLPLRTLIYTPAMDRAETIDMLRRDLDEGQIHDMKSTARLLDAMADFPLAIKLASAYMSKNMTSTAEYLEYFLGLRNRHPYLSMEVGIPWIISFEHISRNQPLASEYLKFICFLAENDIPEPLLPPGDLEEDKEEALDILRAYAFISRRTESPSFDVHQLIQDEMRTWLNVRAEVKNCNTSTIQWLARVFPSPTHETRDVRVRYLPHVQTALEHLEDVGNEEVEISLLSRVGDSLKLLGRHEEAKRWYQHALDMEEKALSREHPSRFLPSAASSAGPSIGKGKAADIFFWHYDCHICGFGPQSVELNPLCCNCEHRRCALCTMAKTIATEDS